MANSVFSKNLRTLTQLPELSVGNIQSLAKGYIELSYPVNSEDINETNYKYNSYKLNGTTLADVLQSDIFNSLGENNGWIDEFNFSETREQLSALYYGDDKFGTRADEFKLRGHHWFTEPPEVGTTLTEFTADVKHRLVNVNSLNLYCRDNSPLFVNKYMDYLTTHHNLENNKTENSTIAPQADSEKHNVYIFQVINYTSESWIAPQSGIFTCYGWLDEYSSSLRPDDNATRWVALEINVNDDPTKKAEWKILQLQPFISSERCSYVGFTFPVKRGAELRIETGFKVGTNSRLYQGVQGSLTNHIANAFVGGVYNAGNEVFNSNAGLDNIVNGEYGKLQTQLINIQQNSYTLETVAKTVNSLLNEINGNNPDLDGAGGGDLQTQLTTLTSRLDTLNAQLNELKAQINNGSTADLSEIETPYSLADLGEKVNTIIDWINNR